MSQPQDFFSHLVALNMLDPEDLFQRFDEPGDGFLSRSLKTIRGPAERIISRTASAVTAKKIKVWSAVDALNCARQEAIAKGQFTFLGPEGRVIQPRDWEKAIKPDSVVEITFNDPQLETENLEKVDDVYINSIPEINVSDQRPSTERMLSRLGIRH